MSGQHGTQVPLLLAAVLLLGAGGVPASGGTMPGGTIFSQVGDVRDSPPYRPGKNENGGQCDSRQTQHFDTRGHQTGCKSTHPEEKRLARIEREARELRHDLEKHGLDVAEGYFQPWRIEDCPQSYAVMETCYFNNPAAPYIMSIVPYWPDEFVDTATVGAFGTTKTDYGTTHRFDPHEAIVILGYLPPKAAYMGIQSYLFTREGDYLTNNATYSFIEAIGASDVFFHRVPGNPARIGAFDSLSNSNNNVVIERQSGGSFNEFRYFIITPDRLMDWQVRQALHRQSVPARNIFTERIPGNMTLGLSPSADDFLTGIRYAMPDDGGGEGTPSDEWRISPTLKLLRIRDTRTHWPAQRYPAWEGDSPEPRDAVSEVYLAPDLDALVRKVSEAWRQTCALDDCSDQGAVSFIDAQTDPFNLVGPLCAEIGMDCVGDGQDASYQFRGNLGFDDGEVYAVIGTLGTATGNATYVSLGLNNFHLRLGAANINDTQLEGSTDPAWYPGVNNLDKFYVYYFTRNCEDVKELTHGYCLPVKETELAIPTGVKASIVERDYISSGTERGPDSTLTLPSRVLKFTRP